MGESVCNGRMMSMIGDAGGRYRSHYGLRIRPMNELPLNALRAFAAVYAHGGVRAAARELGMSSVSRHLAELDRWLGVPLLRASTGRGALVFTPQGEALGRATLAGLRGIEQAVAALRETRPAHAVTLSTHRRSRSAGCCRACPRWRRRIRRSSCRCRWNSDWMHWTMVASTLRSAWGRAHAPALHAEPLMDDALYPVMSPALWQVSGRPSKPARLADLRLLHDRDPQAAWEAWRSVHGPAKLALQGGARYTSSDLVLRAAMQGQGVALARHRLAADDVANGSLLRQFGELDVPLGVSYWIVRPPANHRAGRSAAVIDWLRWQAAGARLRDQPRASAPSTNCCSCAAFNAPDCRAISRPCRNMMSVGMLRMLKREATCGCASVSSLASRRRGSNLPAACTNTRTKPTHRPRAVPEIHQHRQVAAAGDRVEVRRGQCRRMAVEQGLLAAAAVRVFGDPFGRHAVERAAVRAGDGQGGAHHRGLRQQDMPVRWRRPWAVQAEPGAD
ncbi:hypothetical protein LSPH26S_03831 [Lysinibacillus sphaericus]